jgi:hypothetical protein
MVGIVWLVKMIRNQNGLVKNELVSNREGAGTKGNMWLMSKRGNMALSQAFHVLDKLVQFCLRLTIFRLSVL